MKTFAKSPIGLFIFLLAGILLPSCQEGCIDPAACNYNPNAVVDDGTCIYNCSYESQYVPSNSSCTNGDKIFHNVQSQISLNIINEVEGSTHYGEPIVSFNVRKDQYQTCLNDTYQYLGNAEDVISFKNATNRTISFEYKATQTLSDGSIAVYFNKVVQLTAGDDVEINTEQNIFPLLDDSTLKVKLFKVRYHR